MRSSIRRVSFHKALPRALDACRDIGAAPHQRLAAAAQPTHALAESESLALGGDDFVEVFGGSSDELANSLQRMAGRLAASQMFKEASEWRSLAGRERLRAAARRNRPWRHSTGPRTAEGKANAALNGKAQQMGPFAVRQLRDMVVYVEPLPALGWTDRITADHAY